MSVAQRHLASSDEQQRNECDRFHFIFCLTHEQVKAHFSGLSGRKHDQIFYRIRADIENAISSLLPHGRVLVEDVARSLGMSERTLARRLSDEGLNFTEVIQHLRRDLAVRYLKERNLHVSKIEWLLGFHEVSSFTHAFKRWTGETPSQMRTAGAY